MEKQIYISNISLMKAVPLMKVCRDLNVEPVTIKKEDYHKPLGLVAGIDVRKSGVMPLDDVFEPGELLVFKGLEDEELDTFLYEYKRSGGPSIDYKAVMTMNNIYWTPAYLYKAIKHEHAVMSKY